MTNPPHLPSLATLFTIIIYDSCLKNLSKGKFPRLHIIPNVNNFHTMLYLFFLQCYLQKYILKEWKHDITVLFHKNHQAPQKSTNHKIGNPTHSN